MAVDVGDYCGYGDVPPAADCFGHDDRLLGRPTRTLNAFAFVSGPLDVGDTAILRSVNPTLGNPFSDSVSVVHCTAPISMLIRSSFELLVRLGVMTNSIHPKLLGVKARSTT